VASQCGPQAANALFGRKPTADGTLLPPFPAPAYMRRDLEAAGIPITSQEYDSSGNLTMPAINTCLSLRTTSPVTLLSALYIDDTLHEQMPAP
jgi:hypothetical protein